LVDIARHSRSRGIRERIVPKARSTARQGPDYNACLGEFVRRDWDIEASCVTCASLRRAVSRFQEFTPSWQQDRGR
jgi:hypothetical protein